MIQSVEVYRRLCIDQWKYIGDYASISGSEFLLMRGSKGSAGLLLATKQQLKIPP